MPAAIPEVADQFAEEAAFLWLLRDRAVGEPHYRLEDLARLDERVEAHVDGLRSLGDDGWTVAMNQLKEHPEPGETFVAALLAFESGNQGRIGTVLELADQFPLRRAIASALGWLTDGKAAAETALQLAHSDRPGSRWIAAAATGIIRDYIGNVLARGIKDEDQQVRARAARAAGEIQAFAYTGELSELLGTSDPSVRFWSAWSLALSRGSNPAAISELQTVALAGQTFRRRAVDMVIRRTDPRATTPWLKLLEGSPGGPRLTIQALGAAGDPAAIPRLLESMKSPALARVAGESLSTITSVHISYDKLDAPPPADFQSGPTEIPDDDDVALDADGNLSWPDHAKCAAWWSANRERFTSGTRYLCGKPMTPEHLREVLRTGYQRQRAAAALELAIREPGKPLFEIRAPGFRQR